MRVKTTIVYARGATVVLQAAHFADNWARVPGEIRVLGAERLDDEKIGAAVRAALSSVREGVDPDDYPIEPLYEAFGARTWRSFVRDVSALSVGQDEHAFELMPLRNRGNDGFEYAVELARTVPLDAGDAELGGAVVAALTLAEPPIDLRPTDSGDPPDIGPGPEPESEAPDDDGELLADVRRMAGQAAEALNETGYAADFSLASLAEVDRFFDDELRRPGKPRRRGALAGDVGAKLLAIGGYVGETLRRHAGAQWLDEPGTAEDEVQMRLPDGSLIWPVRRVIDRFSLGSEAGLRAYGEVLADRDPGAQPPIGG